MAANSRLQKISDHLAPSSHAIVPTRVGVKSPDDVVIVSALRTPITRARKGPFKDTHPEDLLAAVLKATIEKTKIGPKLVDDICIGNVLPAGGGATVARMAALYAGFPDTTSLYTLNRQCSSGLQAVSSIVDSIRNGEIEIGIGGGVESMTMGYGAGAMPPSMSDDIQAFQPAADCLLPMGITSENVAKEFGVSRAKQDQLAAESHARAKAAQEGGLFDEEIVPVKTEVLDKDGNAKKITVTKDDGIRPNVTAEQLAKLKPAFSADGATTAGNASQVSDGAAAVLLMKRSTAERLKLPIKGKFVSFAVAGVPPRIMGIGPVFAVPKAIKLAGLKSVNEVDLFEFNEAFASQATYGIEKLGLDRSKTNVKGGAIALGHPLGATGARMIATLLPELKRRGKKVGGITMCIGTGMGACGIIEAEY